jgi:hypothetical protein
MIGDPRWKDVVGWLWAELLVFLARLALIAVGFGAGAGTALYVAREARQAERAQVVEEIQELLTWRETFPRCHVWPDSVVYCDTVEVR